MHRILKSDLKMSKASARWGPRLLSEDDCGHNQAITVVHVNFPTSLTIYMTCAGRSGL